MKDWKMRQKKKKVIIQMKKSPNKNIKR